MTTCGGNAEVAVIEVGLGSPHLKAVKELGRANRSTLGFLPEGAFDESAARRKILAVVDSQQQCLGYVLYRTSKGRIALTHLCVAKGSRGKGLARLLVRTLSAQTQQYPGIGLRCRRDYAAHKIWPKLGFSARQEKPGRSYAGHDLTYWWLDHGHANLFSQLAEDRIADKLRVVLDANICFDLLAPKMQEESSALLADWIQEDVELCITDEMFNEVDRRELKTARTEMKETLVARFTVLQYQQERKNSVEKDVAAMFPIHRRAQADSDVRQIAKAIAAGAHFFVTRDDEVLNRADVAYNKFGLSIVRPSDLIVRQDELRREQVYQPARLHGTLELLRRIHTGEQSEVAELFRSAETHERLSHIEELLSRLLARPDKCEVKVALDDSNHSLAMIAYEQVGDDTTVPLLRVKDHPLASTLARFLVSQIVLQAARKQVSICRVTDEHTGGVLKQALAELGFHQSGQNWLRVNLPVVASGPELADRIRGLTAALGQAKQVYADLAELLADEDSVRDSEQMSLVERAIWPAKVTNAPISSFIVPIRPHWAQHLFDAGLASQTLFGAIPELALSLEAVYYRAATPRYPTYPGRIMWYVSKDEAYMGSMMLRACSLVDEVVVGKPRELFKRFRRLGVYQWRDIQNLAKGDLEKPIMAVRFSRTELFESPIPRSRMQEILKSSGLNTTNIQGPISISPDVFFELYKLGRH